MVGKTLIVVFDAINENVDGKALLRQIDRVVGEMRYPLGATTSSTRASQNRISARQSDPREYAIAQGALR